MLYALVAIVCLALVSPVSAATHQVVFQDFSDTTFTIDLGEPVESVQQINVDVTGYHMPQTLTCNEMRDVSMIACPLSLRWGFNDTGLQSSFGGLGYESGTRCADEAPYSCVDYVWGMDFQRSGFFSYVVEESLAEFADGVVEISFSSAETTSTCWDLMDWNCGVGSGRITIYEATVTIIFNGQAVPVSNDRWGSIKAQYR